MDSIQNLIATQTEISSIPGCYIITLLEPEKEEVISNDIDTMITSINVNNITEKLEHFVISHSNDDIAIIAFNNGKLCFCSLPDDKMLNLAITRNFGGVFRDENGIIEGRNSTKMFSSLIASIPRKIAINNCVFIPTPKGYYKKDGSIAFNKGYLKIQFDIIMNIVAKSNERILLAPLWYNPVTNAEHNVHNVFLSIDVDESKKNNHIVGHCIDTLDDLEKWLYFSYSLMSDGG